MGTVTVLRIRPNCTVLRSPCAALVLLTGDLRLRSFFLDESPFKFTLSYLGPDTSHNKIKAFKSKSIIVLNAILQRFSAGESTQCCHCRCWVGPQNNSHRSLFIIILLQVRRCSNCHCSEKAAWF